MANLITRLGKSITGVISGFDRIVFKGYLRRLMYKEGAEAFLWEKGVLNKDFKAWAMKQTQKVVSDLESLAFRETGQGIKQITSSDQKKEQIARKQQQQRGVEKGMIGAWSCVEAGQSFRAKFSRTQHFPELKWTPLRCKHLYVYVAHPEYGFLNLRLQTWFPYQIQICMNGREWLARDLMRRRSSFVLHGNKFLHIDRPDLAQRYLKSQLDSEWPRLLGSLVPMVFPGFQQIVGRGNAYAWNLWQSEWATDLICDKPSTAQAVMAGALRHALITETSGRVLRYMARPLTARGLPYARNTQDVKSRVLTFHDGARVRHWDGKNSVKMYNEQNIIRVESTINDPSRFKTLRKAQNAPAEAPKKRLPIRRGVADIVPRMRASQDINNRYLDGIEALNEATPFGTLLQDCTRRRKKDGRPVRAMEPTGKDRELLTALADHRLAIGGFNNRELRNVLAHASWGEGRTEKQLAARVTRHIRLLRDHRFLRKMPNQHRYQLTNMGRRITTALAATLRASTKDLIDMVA